MIQEHNGFLGIHRNVAEEPSTKCGGVHRHEAGVIQQDHVGGLRIVQHDRAGTSGNVTRA